ncbi:MAG TPA: efflux RND transporter periplasmic adaptor subunit [Clostridia bacterium]|nr:efflux RND transporter periplasmic adaptor subunit [Clostridia bacterium]
MKVIKGKKLIFLIIAVVLVAVLGIGFLNNRKAGPGNTVPASNMQPGANIAISVETQEIKPATIEQYVNVSSKVTANNEISVIPKVSGTVKNVYVNLGDTVKAGDVLFETDDTSLRIAVNQAAASLASAQASYDMNIGANLENTVTQLQASVDSYQIQYDDLLRDLENTRALYEAGAKSKLELDTLQSGADKLKLQLDTAKENLRLTREKTIDGTKKSAEAALEQAQLSYENAQTQLGYTRVEAEIDGVISACNVTVGSTASPQVPAMTIVNTDKLKFSFNISDDYINKVSVGSKAYITISAASEKSYEGTVTYISPAANSTTLLYPVEIYIEKTDDRIKPGMFTSLKLVVEKRENTISVPLNAVLEKGGDKFVYVVDGENVAHRKAVETGIKNDENIEIVSGVQNGEKVVVVGQSFLSDGSAVNVTAGN